MLCRKCNKHKVTYPGHNTWCPVCTSKYAAKRYKENREKLLEKAAVKHRKIKQLVINKYGGKCKCCDIAMLDFLTIDHRNKDGQKHRGNKVGVSFYYKLIKDKFPKKIGLRVLCMNCNWATRHKNKCPHKN